LAAAAAVAAGCGGGGSAGGTAAPATKRVGFFVSSTAGTFSHVWVNIKQAALIGPTAKATLFTSAAGKTIDLASLNQSGTKLFAALGVGSVPQANFSTVQITVDNSVTVIPQGATQGTKNTFAGATGSTKTISFSANSAGTTPIVANFDLSKWSASAGQVSASCGSGDGSQVGSNSETAQDFDGAVGNLAGTAPSLTFDLTGDGMTTHVITDANTVIANSDGSPNPVLANNSRVDVIGTVDPATLALLATTVTIRVGNTVQPNRVSGTIASTGTGTFILNIDDCHGMLPNATTVNVATTATTTFQDGNGITVTAAQFFTAAVVGTRVSAQGTFDQASNTFTATSLSIRQDDHGGGGGGHGNRGLEVDGPVVTVDAANNAFTMTIQHFEGALLTQGSTLTVVTTASTQLSGVTLATLQAGTVLEVKGAISGTTLTATEISTGDDMGDDGGGHGGDDGHDDLLHPKRK